MTTDPRNIIDYYKYWQHDAIVADLDTKRHNFSILCSNIGYDFNLGSIVRVANAFLAKEVIIYGRKRYDRRGAVGTHLYTHFQHVKQTDNLDKVFSQYDQIVGIDNLPGAKAIEDFEWNPSMKTLICFGQEQIGLPAEVIQQCHKVLYIRQYGSVRSLNVGCASAIVMYDYVKKIQEKA